MGDNALSDAWAAGDDPDSLATVVLAPVLADLREQVQALREQRARFLNSHNDYTRGQAQGWAIACDQVLALLDGGES